MCQYHLICAFLPVLYGATQHPKLICEATKSQLIPSPITSIKQLNTSRVLNSSTKFTHLLRVSEYFKTVIGRVIGTFG